MYNPLDRTPLTHTDPHHYLVGVPLEGDANDLFECFWPTRTLAWELAMEIGHRSGRPAQDAYWDAYTGEDESAWQARRAIACALAELGVTVSRINRRKS